MSPSGDRGWPRYRRVVVPIDFSDSCPAAVESALELAAAPADVHVMHVLVPMEHLSPQGLWGPLDNDAEWDAMTRNHLDEWLAKQELRGVTAVVRIGDPGLEIADYAAEQQADLIVLPSHGYHGVKRLVLGSVAERVIRHADCPVLILRRRDAD